MRRYLTLPLGGKGRLRLTSSTWTSARGTQNGPRQALRWVGAPLSPSGMLIGMMSCLGYGRVLSGLGLGLGCVLWRAVWNAYIGTLIYIWSSHVHGVRVGRQVGSACPYI